MSRAHCTLDIGRVGIVRLVARIWCLNAAVLVLDKEAQIADYVIFPQETLVEESLLHDKCSTNPISIAKAEPGPAHPDQWNFVRSDLCRL